MTPNVKTFTEKLDIFLTTMKPLQKVVTAQDIESSLFYVHMDGAADEELRENLLREQDHLVGNGEADGNTFQGNTHHGSTNGVARKPLPCSPQLALGDRPELPPKVYPYYQPPAKGNTQYGRRSAGYNTSPTRPIPEPASMHPSHNILGPRPMHQRLRSVGSAALEAVPERQNVNLRRWSEQSTTNGPPLPPRPHIRKKEVPLDQSPQVSADYGPPLPPRPNISRKEILQSQSSRYSEGTLHLPKAAASDGNHFGEENTSLTLIRRYGGLQWNVGKISNNVDSVTKDLNGMPGPYMNGKDEHLRGAMWIDILTPGYSRFGDSRSEVEHSSSRDLSQTSTDLEILTSQDNMDAQTVFRRRLQTYRDNIRPEFRHTPNSASASLSPRDPRPNFNFRKFSHHSENTIRSEISASPSSESAKMKRYSFLSPWNGTCDFDIGVLGRSIKCKHTLANSKTEPRSAQISELRFNLPSSKAFGPPPKTPSPYTTPRESKRSSFFSSMAHHPKTSPILARNHSQDHLDEYCFDGDGDGDGNGGRMDLSLGQELAGGGFGGKQAKLGKLIIEEEGMKMLDLVVAANVGIWWKVYGRVL